MPIPIIMVFNRRALASVFPALLLVVVLNGLFDVHTLLPSAIAVVIIDCCVRWLPSHNALSTANVKLSQVPNRYGLIFATLLSPARGGHALFIPCWIWGVILLLALHYA